MSLPPNRPAPADPADQPSGADQRQALLDSLLGGATGRARGTGAISPAPRDRPLPLSFAQQRIWTLEQLRPGTAEYLVPLGWELRGPLDATALRRALAELVARHEVLRTRYLAADDEPVQLVDPPGPPDFDQLDLGALPSGERAVLLAELMRAQADEPFELDRQWPLRARLVRLAEQHHALLLTLHHIAFDGWSIGVLSRELGAIYSAFADGRANPLPPLPVQYADFAAWQRGALTGPVDRQLAYWRERLAGATPTTLPTDRPRPAVFDPAGATVPLQVAPRTVRALAELGRSRGATPFMVLLAAFQVLLAGRTGSTDIAVGTPVAGRSRAETRGLLGFFVNTLVMRTDLSGDPSFLTVLDRVRESALDAFAHQDVPFERLVDELAPQRDLSRNPLFQAMIALNNTESAEFGGAGLRATELEAAWQGSKFDLTVQLAEHADGSLHGVLEYATALFDPERMAALAESFVALLDVVCEEPKLRVHQIPSASAAERELLAGVNDTAVEYPGDDLLHTMVEQQARRTPDAVAVRFEGQELTYARLDAEADRVARALRAVGVGPETVVGVCLRRGTELPVALLGVLKAGGAYLPLDPDYPAQRLAHTITDSGTPAVLTTAALAATLPPHDGHTLLVDRLPQPDGPPPAPARLDPDNAAYVIYTSGSTGRPKGVIGTHRGIANRLRWGQDTYRIDAGDRVLHKTPYSFDVSVWELFWPLTTGATLVVARPEGHRDPDYLAATIAGERITTTHFVPAMLRAFLDALPADTELPALRRVLCSGEALPDDLAEAFHRHPATRHAELHNLYGPTEASVEVTATACPPGRPVTLGRPIANTRVHVLDPDLDPVPPRRPGQLALAGVQLARGYLGRPGLTAERFVPDPDARHPGTRRYLTGDLVHLGPDGTLTYHGRTDHQVKLHGHRIELGEIETALRGHPGVGEALVIVHQAGGEQRLVAYTVAADGGAPAPAQLRAHLAGLLPAHMVPTHYLALDAIPLTLSGKADRKALPAPDLTAAPAPEGAATVGHTPPSTPTQHLIARSWAEALKTEAARIGVHDNFFELGGDSIRAIGAVGRLRRGGLDVTVQDVFRHQTVARLAEALALRGGAATAVQAVTATAPFALLADADRERLPAGTVDAYPLSLSQAGMVYEMLAGADRGAYLNNLDLPVRDDGGFSPTALHAAAALLTERHEILRTSIEVSAYSEPLQLVHPAASIEITQHDLRGLAPERRRAELAAGLTRDRLAPFDLAEPALLRLAAYQLDDEQWQLSVSHCHAILDGWSQTALATELLDHYRALRGGRDPAPAAPPTTRFADAVALEKQALASAADQEFWHERVGRFARLTLPQAWAGKPERSGDDGVAAVDFRDLLPGLRAVAGEAGVPLKSVLLAAHLAVLGLISGSTGSPVAFTSGLVCNVRPETVDGDRACGMFLNTVPFALALDAPSWTELARAVFAEEIALWPHRHYPLAAMQRAWGQGVPLVDVFFNHTDLPVPDGGENHPEDLGAPGDRTPNEFGLSVSSIQGGLLLEASAERIGRAELDLLARTYRHVLAGIAADPHADPRRSVLPEPDRHAALTGWPAQPLPPARDLVALFEEQAGRTPDAPAVLCAGGQLTYRQLAERVARLAGHLRALGLGPGSTAAVFLERGPDLLVALLAVLSAGAAYVPLDPEHPAQRNEFVLTDTDASVIISQTALRERLDGLPAAGTGRATVLLDADRELIAAHPGTFDAPIPDPDALAYVIYTSGSTGRPKGVMITRAGLADFLTGLVELPGLRPGVAVAALTTVSFDPSVLELYLPLLVGAPVALATAEETRDPLRMAALLAAVEPSIVQATPVTLRLLLDCGWTAPAGLVVLSGGERLPTELARRIAADGARVVDLYGPTETTVWTTLTRLHPDGSPEHWSLVPGTRLHILDSALEPVPVGVPGEICLGGAGLARGYLNRPGVTAGAFVPDPHARAVGDRLYRTGDLGCRHPDGRVELLGRIDHQVKIRGHRIEPGEIEAVLLGCPEVRAAVVHPTVLGGAHGDGEVELVAYLEPFRGATPPDSAALRDLVGRLVPDYMVPAAFVVLEALPVTPSGKVDRGRLPVPAPTGRARARLAPRTEQETVVARAWCEVLGLDLVGVHDNFFDLGGHSLLATRIALRLREATGLDVPVRALFDRSTVAALAAALPDYPARPAQQLPRLVAGRRFQATDSAHHPAPSPAPHSAQPPAPHSAPHDDNRHDGKGPRS
ncbi:non-ribosomal peptide synthetase [Kitasatospora viridis]|uniref:Amino acid adenylation domain-containing protein n=1 Tax=Kitasatospora viridis TaxID=281105 RepID=A0A561T6D8_9ACTN|nr:non-ribosomal peptide synthetase [Kitasatospora viridis]TWF82683.1 amino acid adenylation domain-containing protein [Kitasatospora viridis]